MDNQRFVSAGEETTAGQATAPRRAYLRVSALSAKLARRCQAWAAARHPAVVAVLFVLPIAVLGHFDLIRVGHLGNRPYDFLYWMAIFAVGAVQRAEWRRALMMALLGGAGCAVGSLFASLLQSAAWRIALPVVFRTCFILSIAIGEAFLMTRRLPRALAWLVALAIAAGAIHILALDFLLHCSWRIAVPTGQVWTRPYGPGALYWPLLAALTWITIPVSAAYSQISWRRGAFTLAGLVLAVVGLVVYEQVVIFEIAGWSMKRGSPFARTDAALLLEYRGRPADFEVLWRSLEENDWRPEIDEFAVWDWRDVCIAILARHDCDQTAVRVSGLLQKCPRRQLAIAARSLLVERRRLETVPILLRYALLDSLQLDTSWREHFQKLGIPETANLIFTEAILADVTKRQRWSTEFDGATSKWAWAKPEGITVAPHLRQALIGILEADVGDQLLDWMELYNNRIDTLRSPLSAAQRRDVQRTCKCFDEYIQANGAWREIRAERQRRYALDKLSLNFPDEFAELERLKGADSLERRKELYNSKSKAGAAVANLEKFLDEARQQFAIQEPDWDVPSIDALEQQIEQYVRRVHAESHVKAGDALPDFNPSL